MELFFKFNPKNLGFFFFIITLFCYKNMQSENFVGNKAPLNLSHSVPFAEGIGFLFINTQVSNTWSLLSSLSELLADETIKAVVLCGINNINLSIAWSYLTSLQQLRQAYNKPIVAYSDSCLREAASYLMACGTDSIIVAPWSTISTIEYGVCMEFLQDKDKAEGKILNLIYSGRGKDENVHVALTAESIKRAEGLINATFDNMLKDITIRRPNSGIYKDKWVQGTSLNAHEALTYGLIDGIADKTTLVGYVLNLAGFPNRNVSNVNVTVKEPLIESSFEHKRNDQQAHRGILKIDKLNESSWDCFQLLLSLFQDPTIDKIILDIDLIDERLEVTSNLYYDILKLKKIYKKPVVAYIHNALSGGYYIASAADYTIASPGAHIGFIGASYMRWDVTQKFKKEHLKYFLLSTGKFVNLFNEKIPLDAANKDILQKQVNFDHAKFVQDIKVDRPALKNTDDSKWADGQIFIAQDALKLGLIDAIGTPLDALNFGDPVINNKVHELNFVVKTIN